MCTQTLLQSYLSLEMTDKRSLKLIDSIRKYTFPQQRLANRTAYTNISVESLKYKQGGTGRNKQPNKFGNTQLRPGTQHTPCTQTIEIFTTEYR